MVARPAPTLQSLAAVVSFTGDQIASGNVEGTAMFEFWMAWRIGKDQWRRHRHDDPWLLAVEEMFQRTSTPHAPWTILEANCKRHAPIKALPTVADGVACELKR